MENEEEEDDDDNHKKDHSENAPFYYLIGMQKSQNKVKKKADALMIKNRISFLDYQLIRPSLKKYIPQSLMPFIEID